MYFYWSRILNAGLLLVMEYFNFYWSKGSEYFFQYWALLTQGRRPWTCPFTTVTKSSSVFFCHDAELWSFLNNLADSFRTCTMKTRRSPAWKEEKNNHILHSWCFFHSCDHTFLWKQFKKETYFRITYWCFGHLSVQITREGHLQCSILSGVGGIISLHHTHTNHVLKYKQLGKVNPLRWLNHCKLHFKKHTYHRIQ